MTIIIYQTSHNKYANTNLTFFFCWQIEKANNCLVLAIKYRNAIMYILSCFTVLKMEEDSPFVHSNCNWKTLLFFFLKAIVVNNVTQLLMILESLTISLHLCCV